MNYPINSRRTKSFVFILFFLFNASFVNSQIPLVHYDSVNVLVENQDLLNPWSGGMNCPQFSEIDLNGDGINDLVTFERNFYGAVKTFLNRGSSGQVDYKYAPEYQALFPHLRNWMLLRDYNCDGKEDIFTSVPAGVAVYRNDTEVGSPIKFTQVTTLLMTIGLDGQTPLYVSPPDIPAITDIDNDGDLDILSFNILGSTIEYHKNLSMENNGNCSQLEFELRNACWGYFSEDGNNNTVSLYDTCELNVPNPEKSAKHAGSTILAIDLYGNGVKDIILGDLTFNNLVMLTNGGTITSSGMIASDTAFPSNTAPVNLTKFPAAYYIDADNDGRKDLLVAPNNPNTSENYNNIWYYKNEGTTEFPEFIYNKTDFLQGEMLDAGERSYSVFFDENGDGLMDIIIGNFGYFISTGNYSSQLMLLRNVGTSLFPSFELISNDYSDLAQFGFNGIYPAFGDMDNDGDMEMITGDEDGLLHYFRNDAEPGDPADFTLSQANYMGIDIGQSAKPQIIDVDRDGLKDLLIGERSGTINYYRNIGTAEEAEFLSEPTNDFFGQLDVMPECCTGFSTPFMVKDSVGNYILYVGSEMGVLYLFNEIENNLDGAFNLVDSLYLNGININVNGTDLNGNGKTEMVMGEYGGGVSLLKYGIPQGLGTDPKNQADYINELYPNPASDKLNVKLKPGNYIKDSKINIVNIFGRVLITIPVENHSLDYEINTSDLSSGIYFIQINSGGMTTSRKIIKI